MSENINEYAVQQPTSSLMTRYSSFIVAYLACSYSELRKLTSKNKARIQYILEEIHDGVEIDSLVSDIAGGLSLKDIFQLVEHSPLVIKPLLEQKKYEGHWQKLLDHYGLTPIEGAQTSKLSQLMGSFLGLHYQIAMKNNQILELPFMADYILSDNIANKNSEIAKELSLQISARGIAVPELPVQAQSKRKFDQISSL